MTKQILTKPPVQGASGGASTIIKPRKTLGRSVCASVQRVGVGSSAQSDCEDAVTQSVCADVAMQSGAHKQLPEITIKELIQLEQHAIKGLVKCVKGYVLKEVKSTYELNVDGEKQIKSEVVTQKQIAPEFAAIVFTLTNINPQRWRAKPLPEKDETPTEDELIDLSGLSEEQLTSLLGPNG